MASKETTTGPIDADGLRRHSVGTIEIQDAKGRRKTVQLTELSEADRTLAEQFGYKPVCGTAAAQHNIRRTNIERIGLQA